MPTKAAKQESFDKRWQITLDGQPTYFAGNGPGASTTRQIFTPVGMQLVAIPTDEWKVELGARSGYVDIKQGTDAFKQHFGGWTDTSLTGTITYYGINGFLPFVSVATNLPTGTTVLLGPQGAAKPDADVFQIPGFGEGLNIGPTVGVNIPITKDLLVSTGVGYTHRGGFDRDGLFVFVPPPAHQTLQHIQPGGVLTGNASIGYQSGPLSLQGSASYSLEEATYIDDMVAFKTGNRATVSGGVGYAWIESLSSKLSASFSHINHNGVVNAPSIILMVEPFNSNSDVTTVTFDTTYKIGMFAIGPTAGYLYRNHNGYDQDTLQFLPAKTKWSAGGTAQYAVTKQASFNARAEYIWLTTADGPTIPPFVLTPATAMNAWIVSLGGTLIF